MPTVNYIERLEFEGYTPRESEFILFAAIHSGYFTLGQFRRYAKVRPGKTSQNLADRVVEKRHAYSISTRKQGVSVLRMSDRLCSLLDVPMTRSGEAKTRLQILDFVTEEQELEYLPREADKVEWMVGLGVSTKVISKQNGRYFDERLPVYRLENGAGFVFVDHGTLGTWESFLERYAALFGALLTVQVVFATASPDESKAVRAFELKTGRLKENSRELAELEAMPVRTLGAPELKLLKRLREQVGDVEGWLNVKLETRRLRYRYEFV